MTANNKSWSLESFVDALVVELDKTREILAVKAVNKPLTYSVKDMALELQIFPTYNGEEVRFTTAGSGEQGASKISLQLASITDKQVRETSKKPTAKGDIKIDQIEVDPETKRELRKMGVTSVNDLENIENRNIDIEQVSSKKVDYSNLANMIRKSKRSNVPPVIRKASLSVSNGVPLVTLEGENLAVNKKFVPVAVVNDQLATIQSYSNKQIDIELEKKHLGSGEHSLVLTLDPYCIIKLNVG
jgi:hypothetical protein